MRGNKAVAYSVDACMLTLTGGTELFLDITNGGLLEITWESSSHYLKNLEKNVVCRL